ncbi:phosphodiester glycosidase family protein [Pirellulaceae bacterium SH501]
MIPYAIKYRGPMGTSRFHRPFFILPALVVIILISFASDWGQCEQPNWRLPDGVQYSYEERKSPRPLRIHRLTFDLSQHSIPIGISAAPDPDAEGPAEISLKSPDRHAKDSGFLAAINTNAWTMLPDPKTGESPGYVVDGHADVKGWAYNGTRLVSPPEKGYWTVWQDSDGRVRIESAAPEEAKSRTEVRWAVAGFGGILKDGKKIVKPSNVLHPRTALGVSHQGQRMVWLVVDGRQPKVSEGVSEEELAELMLESGCEDAVNLDGGGSSILLMTNEKGQLRIANRPSGLLPRPVPVMLGIPASKP